MGQHEEGLALLSPGKQDVLELVRGAGVLQPSGHKGWNISGVPELGGLPKWTVEFPATEVPHYLVPGWAHKDLDYLTGGPHAKVG